MNLKQYKSKIVLMIALLCIIIFIAAYFLNDSINGIINIIIISFLLAYTLKPIRDFLQNKLKISNRFAAIIVILTIISMCIACIIVIIPSLFEEISNIGNIFDNIGTFFEDTSKKLNLQGIPITNSLYNELLEKGNHLWRSFSDNAIENLINISSNIISFAVCPIMIYYFLCDGKKIYEKLLLILPTQKRKVTKQIVNDIDRVLSRYIASQLLLCGIIGVLTFIFLLMFNVKFPLWISILNAIFNIIPYFGPIFGIIPAAIVALIDSPIKCVWIIIGMLAIQQIEGNILSPKITGDSTEMHPFVIIILLLIGDKFGGFVGMILVIPIGVIIKVLYDDINYYLF